MLIYRKYVDFARIRFSLVLFEPLHHKVYIIIITYPTRPMLGHSENMETIGSTTFILNFEIKRTFTTHYIRKTD